MAVEVSSIRARSHTRERIRTQLHLRWLLPVLAIALAASVCVATCVGAVSLPPCTLVESVFGGTALSPDLRIIVFSIRLPRIFAAMIAGSALSISGLLFQGLFRNPLADPYVIGTSGGAVLGASLGVFFLPPISFAGFGAAAVLAFLGAFASLILVYLLASTNGRTPVVTLLLAGLVVSTMLSYAGYFLDLFDRNSGAGLRVLASWLHGTMTQPTWPQLSVVAAMLLVGIAGASPLARSLNTLALGEEYAAHLGLPVQQTRIAVILIGALLTAAAVALAGMVSFVGLIVPHMMRLLLGPDHVRLLPATALAGALFLLVADTAARTIIAPAEFPVGVLTAFLGGPFFLWLLRRVKREILA